MDSQITKIPSICGDGYPGVGFQVDNGDSVRVAMAWPSASAGGWRSLTMEVPKKLSLETELNGVSVETLLKAAGQLLGDNDLDEASGYLPPDALPFNLSMYVNDEGLYSCQPNRAFYATESMEHEGYYSAIDGKPVVSGLPSSLLFGNIVITGFNPETGEDKSLSAGEMMDAMNYFQRDSPRGSGREVALIVQNGLYGELRQSLSHDPSAHEDETLDKSSESLDEMMEQKVEVAGDGEIGDDLGVSNGER